MKKLIIGCLILATGINQAADTPVRPNLDLKELELELKAGADGTRGNQESMREILFAKQNFGDNPGAAFFGIYEGYGTDEGAHILASGYAPKGIKPLHELIVSPETKLKKPSRKRHIENAYLAMDASLKSLIGGKPITTALTALINIDTDIPILDLAWAGSSRALLVNSDGTIAYATNAHTTDNSNELKRIELLGLREAELERSLAQLPQSPSGKSLTRALGVPIERTSKGKSISTIPNPETKKIDLKLHHKALIIASDGLWDTVNENEVAKYVLDKLKQSTQSPRSNNNDDSTFQAAEGLVDLAYQHGSNDNITVLVIEFVWKNGLSSATDVPRLSKALNNLLQTMNEEPRKKSMPIFEQIFELLAKKSPNYAAIKSIIGCYYRRNSMKPGSDQLFIALKIFDHLARDDHAGAEKVIKEYNLLPE